MSRRNAILFGGIIAGCLVVALLARSSGQPDDQALHALLLGNWRATDVDTASFSLRTGPLAKEEFIISPDGTLRHIVIPHPGSGEPASYTYHWRIFDGKLCLRRMTDAQQELPPISITVDQSRLRLRAGGFSTKVFERITS